MARTRCVDAAPFQQLPCRRHAPCESSVEQLEERLREFTNRRRQANAFDLRYAADVEATDERWELFERVLARHDVVERLSRAWGQR
jgi:hypothetical protein